MQVHQVVILAIDPESFGPDVLKDDLERIRYPTRLKVMEIQTREVPDTTAHPIEEFQRLFER